MSVEFERKFVVISRSDHRNNSKAREAMQELYRQDIQVIRTLKSGALLVKTTDNVARMINNLHPDWLLEPVKHLYPFNNAFVDPLKTLDLRGGSNSIRVRVSDNNGKPLPSASVLAFHSWSETAPFESQTDGQGRATVEVIGNEFQLAIFPYANHWDLCFGCIDVDQLRKEIEIQVNPLTAPGTFDWGHMEMETYQVAHLFRGLGTRVGVIDTGVYCQHEDLAITNVTNIVNGLNSSWHLDPMRHGTHCAGIIGAQGSAAGIKGHAPETELYVYNVFPEGGAAESTHVADAIDQAIADDVDILNISIGYEYDLGEAQVITQAFRRALDAGIICCVAAGNHNSLVGWPAATDLPNVISISAIGKYETYPHNSMQKKAESEKCSYDGKFFRAAFSNFGDPDGKVRVHVCAPGVSCISTVKGGYSSLMGTSAACAHVTGLMALLLEAHPEIRYPKCDKTAIRATEILKRSCRDLGLNKIYQGAGIPSAYLAVQPR